MLASGNQDKSAVAARIYAAHLLSFGLCLEPLCIEPTVFRILSPDYFLYTTPPFITKLTFSSAPMSSSGFPSTAIASAK